MAVLRQARRAGRVSQRALAARAGVSQSLVARIESGRVDPSVGLLSRLVALCGCQLEVAIRRRPTWRHVTDWVGELRGAQEFRAWQEGHAVRAEYAAARAAAASVAESWLTVRAKREVSKQARLQERTDQRLAIQAALAEEAALCAEGLTMDAGEHALTVADTVLDVADRVPLEPLRRAHLLVAAMLGRPDECAEVDIGLDRLRPLHIDAVLWPFDHRPPEARPPKAFLVLPDRTLAEQDPDAFAVLRLAAAWSGTVITGAVARWLVDPHAGSTVRARVGLAVPPRWRAAAARAVKAAGLRHRVRLHRDYLRWYAGSSPIRLGERRCDLRLQRPEQATPGRWAVRASTALLALERRDTRGRRWPPYKEPPVLLAD